MLQLELNTTFRHGGLSQLRGRSDVKVEHRVAEQRLVCGRVAAGGGSRGSGAQDDRHRV